MANPSPAIRHHTQQKSISTAQHMLLPDILNANIAAIIYIQTIGSAPRQTGDHNHCT